ncbi:MAG: adenosylmethionine--8-amino-7-oxononanoate transaminase [Gammaproteobacteria bacterium]|nr:adenosylmethionine--8-amino-7-oxononanoate transaminase [Gammaproteobacteria bacterium]MCP5137135.1 adenosylmethionine--8-amino-7-oxononanoate transaminase [Gammaproteobacteria bacterium]
MNHAPWQAFERAHVWHPYARVMNPPPVHAVESAQGVRLKLADGREVIDGMASWWCAIHGYNHPTLNAAIHSQTERMAHVMFGGLTHEPAAALAEKLIAITPDGLDYVFLADSGSVAVEVAIKMAMQYWQAVGQPGKSRLLTIRGGYHGDTFGAMSVCDPVNGMHHLFADLLPKHLFAPRPTCRVDEPWNSDDIADFRHLLERHADELAAVILEPIVQGAGGMWFYHPDYLGQVRALCDAHNVLLIADEIATGFGRSGTLFACERAAIAPDILCLGKALTGGYMTLAATLTTERIAAGISAAGAFMHGPTFMANPLACAVAGASIDLLLDSPWQARVNAIETQLKDGLTPLRSHPAVADVRVLGAIGVIETRAPIEVSKVQDVLLENGVWLRPFGKLLYTMPPYVMTRDDLTQLIVAMQRALDAC